MEAILSGKEWQEVEESIEEIKDIERADTTEIFEFIQKGKTEMSVEITANVNPEVYINQGDISTLFYNIVQNPYKHEEAWNINIEVIEHDNTVDFIFMDDGNGSGIGLRHMDERVEKYQAFHHDGINGVAKIIITLPQAK